MPSEVPKYDIAAAVGTHMLLLSRETNSGRTSAAAVTLLPVRTGFDNPSGKKGVETILHWLLKAIFNTMQRPH
jgi:hypothetical protein